MTSGEEAQGAQPLGEGTTDELLPEVHWRPDEVDVFQYSAIMWNSHRIHYDLPYTTQVAGQPRLVVPGPLQGTYLEQLASGWIGDRGHVTEFSYRNRASAYIGDEIIAGGRVLRDRSTDSELVVELWAKLGNGTMTVAGEAIVQIDGDASNRKEK